MKRRSKSHDWELVPYETDLIDLNPGYFLWEEDGVVRLSNLSDPLETIDFHCRKDVNELITRLVKARAVLPEKEDL